MKKLSILGIALMAFPLAAAAQEQAAPVEVSEAYARSANPATGAVFMQLANTGDQECTLSGATSDVAERVELHTHREEDGVMKMVAADPIAIAPGAHHELARGADHVMLLGLHEPLANADELALTLDFGDCGTVETVVAVDNDRAAGGHDHGDDDHGHDDGHANH